MHFALHCRHRVQATNGVGLRLDWVRFSCGTSDALEVVSRCLEGEIRDSKPRSKIKALACDPLCSSRLHASRRSDGDIDDMGEPRAG